MKENREEHGDGTGEAALVTNDENRLNGMMGNDHSRDGDASSMRRHNHHSSIDIEDDEEEIYSDDEEDDENDDYDDGGDSGESDTADDILFRLRRPMFQANPLAPGRMELTDNERHWALNIKSAFQRTPDLESLSDFEYAQLAILHRFDVLSAMARARRLQQWRRQYSIPNAHHHVGSGGGSEVANARPPHHDYALQALMRLFPGLFESLSYNPTDGCYVLVQDSTKYDERKVEPSCTENHRIWVTGCYYVLQAMAPDMESIRQGHDLQFHGEEYGMRIMEKIWSEFRAIYPCRFRSIQHVQQQQQHGQTMMLSSNQLTTSSILDYQIQPSSLMDCRSWNTISTDPKLLDLLGRNGTLCTTSRETTAAPQRLVWDLQEALERRHENETSFSLSG